MFQEKVSELGIHTCVVVECAETVSDEYIWLYTDIFSPLGLVKQLYNSHYYVMAPRKPNKVRNFFSLLISFFFTLPCTYSNSFTRTRLKQKWIGPERHDVDRALTSSVLGHRKGQDMKTYR